MSLFWFSPIFVSLFFFTGMAMSWAQEKIPELNTLEILKLIEANGDYAFAVAGADISIAQARLEEAKSALYPSLTLNTTGQVYQSTQKSSDGAEIYGALEVVKPIYDFGRKSSEIDAAGYDVEAAQQALIATRNMVLLEGLALFYNLHASELQLRAYNEIHASAYVRWDRAKEQLGLAQISPIDVSKALMLVEKTRLDYYRERSLNNTYRLRLEELTNQSMPEELISPPLPPKSPPHEADREEFAKIVVQRNPEMVALTKLAKAKSLRRSAVSNLPSVEAFGNVGHSSRDMLGRNEYSVGARMSWQVFDGGLKGAKRNRLAAEENHINARMEFKRQQLRRKAHVTLMNRADIFQRVISAKAELDYAQKNMLRRQQLYSQERVADLGRAMVENSQAEAALIRATGAYKLELAGIALLLGDHPSRGLEDGYLTSIMGSKKAPTEGYVPKGGSGFGQADQNKVNRNTE
jgi:outer membrane protein TolC